MKIGYQLKQVRERLAKGLVDKGILRTEKKNFLLFDMATHPVADGGAKEEIRRRVRNVLTQRTVVLPGSQWLPEDLEFRYVRTIAMVCAAYAANVLENALASLGHESRERAFAQVDELLAEYSQYPFGKRAGGASGGVGANLGQVITEEVNNGKERELQLEVISAMYGFPIGLIFKYRSSPPVSMSSLDWIRYYKKSLGLKGWNTAKSGWLYTKYYFHDFYRRLMMMNWVFSQVQDDSRPVWLKNYCMIEKANCDLS